MIRSAVAVVALLMVSCSTPEKRKQDETMNEIESSIRLPPGARPLDGYARYYTEHEGKVHGAYTTHIEAARPSDFRCEDLQSNGSSKLVACPALADVSLGQRRWVKYADYPAVAGEDCTAIQLMFDPRTREIVYLKCIRPIH